MADIFRTFRFYGNFRVATKRDSDQAVASKARLLEIFHADRDENGRQRCFVRFSGLQAGQEIPTDIPDAPPIDDNIFAYGMAEIYKQKLIDTGEAIFWICIPRVGTGGTKFAVYDALCCDQFDNHPQSTPSERFALAARYTLSKKQRSSAIIFGSASNYNMRLELAFPLPTPIYRADNDPVLPLGGLYPTSLKRSGETIPDFLTSNLVLVGPSGNTEVPGSNGRLGHFGLGETTDEHTIKIGHR